MTDHSEPGVIDGPAAAGLAEITPEINWLWVAVLAGDGLDNSHALIVFGALQTVLLNFATMQGKLGDALAARDRAVAERDIYLHAARVWRERALSFGWVRDLVASGAVDTLPPLPGDERAPAPATSAGREASE